MFFNKSQCYFVSGGIIMFPNEEYADTLTARGVSGTHIWESQIVQYTWREHSRYKEKGERD